MWVEFYFIDLRFEGNGGENLNASFSLFHMTAKLIFPLVKPGNQGGVGALGVDQHDIVQRILMEPAHGGKVLPVSVTFKKFHDALFDTGCYFLDPVFV